MREHFAEYYRPSEAYFAALWGDATVVLDASVLLDLYRYSESTVDETLSVLQVLRDANRLWLPHQAALEYHRGRPEAIVSQETEQYDVAHDVLSKLKKLTQELRSKLGQHAYLDREATAALLEKATQDYEDHLKMARDALPNFREHDSIRSRLDALYDGLVGVSWTEDQLAEVEKQGKVRYEREIPPGFADREKPTHLRYGDLVFWLQINEFAAANSLDIIIVTNDAKEDWWTKPRNRSFGPHPGLRAEFEANVGTSFYLYSHDAFLKWAADYLELDVGQDAIDEVRDVRQTKEVERASHDIRWIGLPPDLTASLGRLSDLTASLAMPDLSKTIGSIKFPQFPDLTATLNIPDYSRLFQVGLPADHWEMEGRLESGEDDSDEGDTDAGLDGDGGSASDAEPKDSK